MGYKKDRIAYVKVHLVSMPVRERYSDATRKVESIGYTIVRVATRNGVEGFGITYHEAGGEATKVLIENNIAPKLIGRDPFETESIWNEIVAYLRGIGRKGLTFCALSAVDIALWDIKGKMLNIPLYKLFGGNNPRVPVYGSGGWTSYSDEQLVNEMLSLVREDGYSIIKFKVGVECGNNINRDVCRVAKVREAVGPDVGILLDANNCWDAATAVRFANMVKEQDIILLEEPVLADDLPGLKRYKKGTDVPLATGEHEYTKYGCRDLLLNDAVDYVQIDGTRAGGFTEMLKIASITQAWCVKFAPHAMENIHIHLVAAFPNAPFLERLKLFENITANVYLNAPKPDHGYMTIPDLPGLGLILNMDFIRDYEESF